MLPAGSYEAKVAIDESWTENYAPRTRVHGAADFIVTTTYMASTHAATLVCEPPPTPEPSVGIVGSHQAGARLPRRLAAGVRRDEAHLRRRRRLAGRLPVPAGNWEYKAALNDGWDENYGANAVSTARTSR